jgi:two-component SAPR family response regulator
VVGPFSRCSDALAAIEADEIDAAILDVNLDGEMVYPLADMLTERGVPFIFVTGYGAESIEERFTHIPVIQKPVERHVLQRIFVRSADEKLKPVRLRDGNGSIRASVG